MGEGEKKGVEGGGVVWEKGGGKRWEGKGKTKKRWGEEGESRVGGGTRQYIEAGRAE